MCPYSVLSDWVHRWIPQPGQTPWDPSPIDPYPYPEKAEPKPVQWDSQMLKEFMDIVERVRKLEEAQEKRPCQNADERKMDFFKEIKDALERMENEGGCNHSCPEHRPEGSILVNHGVKPGRSLHCTE